MTHLRQELESRSFVSDGLLDGLGVVPVLALVTVTVLATALVLVTVPVVEGDDDSVAMIYIGKYRYSSQHRVPVRDIQYMYK